jgi:hypothetical protein
MNWQADQNVRHCCLNISRYTGTGYLSRKYNFNLKGGQKREPRDFQVRKKYFTPPFPGRIKALFY